ncbi:MAG: hypothetical protein U5K32_05880 [Bacteroidales bacterium]|nr:hypothetical protein [Bacteroidales bacterium]
MNRFCLFLTVVFIIFSSCDNRMYYEGDMANVEFSDDTVHFDTVFTSIGTTTRELRIINPYRKWLHIDRIELAGGEDSFFRLNIDGIASDRVNNVDIAPEDSLFIFIDAIIDPSNLDNPVLINDSIEFDIKGNIIDVNLIAWGQDIILLNSATIKTETWNAAKPYVIYNSVFVDTGHVLTINEGVEILFHRGSGMYVAGTLVAEGSVEKPVIFASDRVEKMYDDIPGQWQGLYFLNGSTGNIIGNAKVLQAVSGIHSGNLDSDEAPPDLDLYNLFIAHMSVAGISSLGGTIDASNIVIANCGYYCAFLAAGGEYSFIHSTMANRWTYSNRMSPSLYISDYYDNEQTRYTGDLVKAGFYNTVVTGNMRSEIYIESATGKDLEVEFVNCFVQNENLQAYNYDNCIFNLDPGFYSWNDYDFRPDTLSPLVDAASFYYADRAPYDILGNNRLSDEAPDIGAYEKQPGENADEN